MILEPPSVTCIVLNWNGWADTIECLKALERCVYPRLNVVVVDNGSTNDSVLRIKAAHPGVALLEAGRNLGFAGGNNIGIRYALERGADFVWLLNNDTEAAADALSALVGKATGDREIGAVASVCYYADSPSTVQAWAGARVNLWIGYARNSVVPRPDAWFQSLYGASILLRSEALREAGLLDEGFFHYLEETELCLRLVEKGWRLAAAPESKILHKVAGSTGRESPVLDRYFTASGLRILRLHSPAPGLAMFLFLAARFARRLARLQFSRCGQVWAGIADYRMTLPVVQRIR
ncbi:glycosyl transferase, family 2 [Acidisarcina polymorpha]|uniref:Glycosyl transferase, family 2 n=1 Tax=Acidisarcina polymorpha TaxID=2211140 RepID=A0A2Z5FXB3_9BACT|nr:glycosyltransferase family 2 protein [Acidisarcina polymorpha]AXC11518.1 glycosyl transferase, family 2 [Acidisarcina polymorpha]